MPSCRCPRVLHLTICFVKEALRLIEVLDTLQPLWYCKYWNSDICHPADCFRSAVHLTVFTSGFHQGALDEIVQLCLLPSAVTSLLFTRFCVSSAGFLLHLAVSVFYNENGQDRFWKLSGYLYQPIGFYFNMTNNFEKKFFLLSPISEIPRAAAHTRIARGLQRGWTLRKDLFVFAKVICKIFPKTDRFFEENN